MTSVPETSRDSVDWAGIEVATAEPADSRGLIGLLALAEDRAVDKEIRAFVGFDLVIHAAAGLMANASDIGVKVGNPSRQVLTATRLSSSTTRSITSWSSWSISPRPSRLRSVEPEKGKT